MKEKKTKGIRKMSKWDQYQNDHDYPWDERYTVDFGGIDTIKRCMDVDGVTFPGRECNNY